MKYYPTMCLVLALAILLPAPAMAKSNEATALLAVAQKAVGLGPRQLGTRSSLWCADFINKMLAKIGHRGTKSALAASFEHWGRPATANTAIIGVKKRRGGNHVVIIKRVQGNTVLAISGNSGGRVRLMNYTVRQFYSFRSM